MTIPTPNSGWVRTLALASGLGLCSSVPAGPAVAVDGVLGLSPMTSASMEDLRGRNNTSDPIHDSFNTQTTVQSNQQLDASINGSSFNAGTINSGQVTIGEHALDNFSGVGVFNIITGNNNAVDAAVGVTINLQ